MPAGTRIKLRRDIAANWISTNPVLVDGEPGYETNTGKLKIGDGSTAWNSLGYFAGSAGASAFIDLSDVPASYSGQADKLVAVKGDETGLEFITAPTTVHAGKTTLSSGSVTVSASWVTVDTVIVVTPCTAPSTSGTCLYVDPANIVASTSFDISSDDATDARDVFWHATEPTEAPPESAFALKTDGSSVDAYLYKIFGAGHNEVWTTFKVAIPSSSLTDVLNNDADLVELWNSGASQNAMSFPAEDPWPINGYTSGCASSTSPVADTWIQIEIRTLAPDDIGELYIGGSLACSYDGTSCPAVQELLLGQYNGSGGTAIVYFKDVLIGTTRSAGDIFSEDFSGDLSAWDVIGDCTIVSDPF